MTSRLPALILALLVIGSNSQAQDRVSSDTRPPDNFSELTVEPISALALDANDDTVPDRLGEWVRVRGTITVEPGVLGREFFQTVIQDDTGGVFIFSYDFDEQLNRGQRVDVAGQVAQHNGVLQLQSIEVLDAQSLVALPQPQRVELQQLRNRSRFGSRVEVTGEVVATDVSRHVLVELRDGDDHRISLFVPESRVPRVPWSNLREGARLRATGVASLHDRAWPYNSGWQVVVTEPQNIELLRPPRPAWWGYLKWIALLGTMIVIGVVILLVVLNRRRRQQQRETDTLNALSAALGIPNLSASQLAQRACTHLCQHGLFHIVAIHVYDDYGRLGLLASSEDDGDLKAMLDYGQIGRAGELSDSGQLSAEQMEGLSQRLAKQKLFLTTVRPLSGRDRPIGFLSVFACRSPRLTFGQSRVLSSASKLIALGLEHIEDQSRSESERAELSQLANTDSLTGLYNRRFLDDYLRVQSALARRRNAALGFFALDIDHFKSMNDDYGHAVGDAVLKKLASVLQEATRASDLVVRQGGEEFLVVTSDSELKGALEFGERLRQAIADTDFTNCGLRAGTPVTVSLGIALFPLHGEATEQVLEAADQALYDAKNKGRNRVSAAPPP